MGFASRWAVLASPRWRSAGLAHVGHDGHGHADMVMAATVMADMPTPATAHTAELHAGHAHGAHANGAQAHSAPAHPAHAHSSWFFSLFSPRVLFALLVGFGAGGLLASPLGEPWRAGAAVLAAAAFEGLLVGPLWRMLFRFESSPAATLESTIEDDARAVMGFDANGQGLVALDVDGQVVQLLATLSADDRARGARVRSGDLVRVSSIDAARHRCTVRIPDR
jgi:hypothetical protein